MSVVQFFILSVVIWVFSTLPAFAQFKPPQMPQQPSLFTCKEGFQYDAKLKKCVSKTPSTTQSPKTPVSAPQAASRETPQKTSNVPTPQAAPNGLLATTLQKFTAEKSAAQATHVADDKANELLAQSPDGSFVSKDAQGKIQNISGLAIPFTVPMKPQETKETNAPVVMVIDKTRLKSNLRNLLKTDPNIPTLYQLKEAPDISIEDNQISSFKPSFKTSEDKELVVVKGIQTVNNIPILGGDFNLVITENKIKSISGSFQECSQTDTRNPIAPEDANFRAFQDMGVKKQPTYYSSLELKGDPELILLPKANQCLLAYQLFYEAGSAIPLIYLVNAKTGEIIWGGAAPVQSETKISASRFPPLNGERFEFSGHLEPSVTETRGIEFNLDETTIPRRRPPFTKPDKFEEFLSDLSEDEARQKASIAKEHLESSLNFLQSLCTPINCWFPFSPDGTVHIFIDIGGIPDNATSETRCTSTNKCDTILSFYGPTSTINSQDTFRHELGHSIYYSVLKPPWYSQHRDQFEDFWSAFSPPFENSAMNEGFADFFVVIQSGSPMYNQSLLCPFGRRNLEHPLLGCEQGLSSLDDFSDPIPPLQESIKNSSHRFGLVFSSALWDLRSIIKSENVSIEKVNRDTAKFVLTALNNWHWRDDFYTAAAKTRIVAKFILGEEKARAVEDVFERHGIHIRTPEKPTPISPIGFMTQKPEKIIFKVAPNQLRNPNIIYQVRLIRNGMELLWKVSPTKLTANQKIANGNEIHITLPFDLSAGDYEYQWYLQACSVHHNVAQSELKDCSEATRQTFTYLDKINSLSVTIPLVDRKPWEEGELRIKSADGRWTQALTVRGSQAIYTFSNLNRTPGETYNLTFEGWVMGQYYESNPRVAAVKLDKKDNVARIERVEQTPYQEHLISIPQQGSTSKTVSLKKEMNENGG